jgi:3-phenylpropionate/cinnamic acid dioxygenase small subunit
MNQSIKKQISAEDHVAVMNLLNKYQWLVDEGDSDGWAALWTEDATFIGAMKQPLHGQEQLRSLPGAVLKGFGGKIRHLMGNCYVEYGDTTDEVRARFYNLVTTWLPSEGAQFFAIGSSSVLLVRRDAEWKIREHRLVQLLKTGEEVS